MLTSSSSIWPSPIAKDLRPLCKAGASSAKDGPPNECSGHTFGIVGCALQRGAAELSDPSPSSPAGAVSLGHSQDSKTGHCWGTVFGSANCIGPHWDIPMLGEGPDGHVPPVPPTRRVSELERPQPSPGWGRFLVSFWEHRRLATCKSYRPWHQAAFRGTGIFPNGLSRLMLGYPRRKGTERQWSTD